MFSGLKVHVVILLHTSALVCTIYENHFHCYFLLLVSFVLFGCVVKCFMEQSSPTVSYEWWWAIDSSM